MHTFTVTHQNMVPPFRDHLPYVLAYVELDEGPRVLTNIVGCDPADVRIGQPSSPTSPPPTETTARPSRCRGSGPA